MVQDLLEHNAICGDLKVNPSVSNRNPGYNTSSCKDLSAWFVRLEGSVEHRNPEIIGAGITTIGPLRQCCASLCLHSVDILVGHVPCKPCIYC